MPSFMEIPEILRKAESKDGFIRWLASLPIPYMAKRKLAQLWSANTNARLSPIDWSIIVQQPTTKPL